MTRFAAAKQFLLIATISLACATIGVHASATTLNPSGSGEVTDFFDHGLGYNLPGFGWIYIRPPSHSYTVSPSFDKISYFVGGCNTACGLDGGTWSEDTRGYWIFDLSSLSNTIVSASLNLQLSVFGDTNGISLFGLDSMSASALNALSASSSSGQKQSAYNDIGSGTSYGSIPFSSSGDGAYSAPLNAQALSDINEGSELLAIGVSLGGNVPGFGESVYFPYVSLTLAEAASSVSAPATAWLFVSALLGLSCVRRHPRSARADSDQQ